MTEINLWKKGNEPLEWRGYKEALDTCIDIPSEWNELTRQELLLISKDLMRVDEKGYEIKASILTNILALRSVEQKIKLPRYWQHNLNDEDVVHNGFDCLNFLFNSVGLTKQLVPVITIHSYSSTGWGVSWMHGPSSNFDDITCGEYEDAKLFFDMYKNGNDIKDLAMMCAVLWRPRAAGKRIQYPGYKPEKKVHYFLSLAPELLMANFFWFAGCLSTLPKQFPKAFDQEEDGPEDLSAFTKCIHAGAGAKNGTREQVRKLLAKEFFFDMELEAIKSAEMENDYINYKL